MALALAASPAAWIHTDVSTALHIARQDSATTSRAGRYGLLGTAAVLAVLAMAAGAGALRGGAAGAAVAPDPLAARVARLEAALAEARNAAPSPQAAPVAQADRFIAAALLLQAAVATPRPWLREYQVMVALAPPGALPAPRCRPRQP